MRTVVVLVQQTLTGWVLYEAEDDVTDKQAAKLARTAVSDGDLTPHWEEHGSIVPTEWWTRGAPCKRDDRGAYWFCLEHTADGDPNATQCGVVAEYEAYIARRERA